MSRAVDPAGDPTPERTALDDALAVLPRVELQSKSYVYTFDS